jgi:hypothetical protein
MSEVEIQEPVCGKCGVEVRPDTAFCYNCGAQVTSETAQTAVNGKRETKGPNIETGDAENKIPDEIRDAENGLVSARSLSADDRRPEPPKYESAAGLRRRSKQPARKPVEVTWEPESEAINFKFIIATACLVVFVLVLVVAALYLK